MHPEEHKKMLDERAAERVITHTEGSKVVEVKHTCQICNTGFKLKGELKVKLFAHELWILNR